MLLSRLISLTAESNYPILGALGRPAQAWFLGQVTRVTPAMAAALHDETGLKPYSVSTLLDEYGRPLGAGMWLKPGQECWLRITTLDDALSKTLENQVLTHLPDQLTLYKMNFRVNGVARNRAEHPWAGDTTFGQLAQDAVISDADSVLRLEFASPTAFRSKGLDVSLPYPGQVFRSLWDKWNAFCPEPMQVQDVWPDFAEDCIVVNELTAVNSTRWVFAGGARGEATGFTGTVGFRLPPKKKLPERWQPVHDGAAAVMQTLARFAFYAGVGHHATIGMGQVRSISPATSSR